MTEPVSSSSSPSSSSPGMTIDIRPMIEDVSQVMTKHITTILSGVIGEYTIYKETHDTIMGLPCVRKLQERIDDLEGGGHAAPAATATATNSREDEIAQLQSAIIELNRYIIALETKVDMKSVCPSKVIEVEKDEESVRLEIHEDDDNPLDNNETVVDAFTVSSRHKNVIISNTDTTADDAEYEGDGAVEDFAEEDDESEEEATEEAAEEATEEEDAVEEEAEEAAEEAEEEEAAEETEEEETEEEEAVEEEEEAVEEAAEETEEAAEETEEAAEETEEAVEEAEEAEEAEEEEAEEEEAEIEVSEVKIKGKTYFTTDPQNGIIYACVDEDVGDEVGIFKNGVAVFNKGKK